MNKDRTVNKNRTVNQERLAWHDDNTNPDLQEDGNRHMALSRNHWQPSKMTVCGRQILLATKVLRDCNALTATLCVHIQCGGSVSLHTLWLNQAATDLQRVTCVIIQAVSTA